MITAQATSEFNAGLEALLAAAVVRGLEAGAVLVQAEAKVNCPVDTGTLQASISTSEVSEDEGVAEVAVFTDIEYAGYVEFGTGIRGASSAGAGPYPYSPTHPGMAAQPYMRPALDTVGGQVMKAIEQEVAGAIR